MGAQFINAARGPAAVETREVEAATICGGVASQLTPEIQLAFEGRSVAEPGPGELGLGPLGQMRVGTVGSAAANVIDSSHRDWGQWCE